MSARGLGVQACHKGDAIWVADAGRGAGGPGAVGVWWRVGLSDRLKAELHTGLWGLG